MKPIIEPLARWQRTLIFVLLLSAFIISLPAFIFYATGYRYDFFAAEPTITATGGLYIAADAPDALIYVNEEEVTNARVFRKASYIQGLLPGTPRVHVQSLGHYTWVKELPVFPHIVTEAEAFNLPLRPQVRPITEFSSVRGESIIFATTTAQKVFTIASSSVVSIAATGTATTSYLTNSEYSVLKLLFAEQEEILEKKQLLEKTKFSFSTTTATTSVVENATTTKNQGNLTLYQNGEDVYVSILDRNNKIPYYFCTTVPSPDALIIDKLDSNNEEIFTETDLLKTDAVEKDEKCRSEIRIDRKGQAVLGFDFLPENPNLVVMHLTEGIYVVEIDDRSWQNTQMLYPGNDLKMLIYGGNIFVKEKDFMFEVLTEIPLK